MLFPTFDFLVFVIPVLVALWALSHRPVARVLLLLAASYFFYMAGPKTDPPPTPWYFAGLLVFSTVLDFVCGHQIFRRRAAAEHPDPAIRGRARRSRGLFLLASLVGNLGLLGYFKYTDFFLSTFSDVARAWGLEFTVPVLDLALPIGISFYTFQSLSYTIDIWRGRLAPEPSFRKFALFVTFFPQLVAGPIVRANEFLPQLHRRPRLSAVYMEEGLFRIFKGLVKKVVFGDWIAAQFTDAVLSSPEMYTSPEILLGLYAFTLQLYADFSGYSDIAIGVSRLMGFEIPENFDRPYQARNLGEFWRRWHMTLSTWLRDYLFFPLGGSRGSANRTLFNLWLTMFLVGMWHYSQGTSWNFVIYSNLHAFAMVFNRWNRTRDRAQPWSRKVLVWVGLMALASSGMFALSYYAIDLSVAQSGLVAGVTAVMFVVNVALPTTGTPVNTALHILITFHFTVISRIFFRAESFEVAKRTCQGLLSFDGKFLREGLLAQPTTTFSLVGVEFGIPWLWVALIFGTAYHFTPKHWVDVYLYGAFRRVPGPILGAVLALLSLGLMFLMASSPRAFIYFQF